VTSSGLRVSADRLGTVRHFTLSREEEPLSAPDVERLAEAVGVACAAAPLDVVAGVASTFHVLVPVRSGRGGL
jgi:hypothetical protein